MKEVLIVQYAASVTIEQAKAFLDQVPDAVKADAEIQYKQINEMPPDLIFATPKTMKERGLDLINQSKKR